MKAEKIKAIYENMPKGVKRIFAPYFIRSIIKNPVYLRTISALDEYESMDEDKRNEVTLNKLKETLAYAYEHTAYYKKLFDEIGFVPSEVKSFEDIKVIPFMDKNLAVEHKYELLSDENISYYESHTSGSSSGKVFEILLDKDSIYMERAFMNHYLQKFGYDPRHSRTVAFWGHNKDKDYYYSPLKNEIVISPFRLFKEEEFEGVWKDIVKFKPDMIAGYPSALFLLAQLAKKNNKSLDLKIVQFYAENYTDEIKKTLEETFNCPAVATYGHTERQVFGELYGDEYKFNGLYGYTELVPIPDEENRNVYKIVCTGFNSRKMPLIRYATDDAVIIDEKGIHIMGHTTSEAKVIGKNGARIYKGTLSPHSRPFSKVKLYQYVQHEPGKVFLDLILDEPFTQEDFDELNAYYERKCEGLLDVEIRIVKELKLNKRGKYSWLVSDLK